jgi:hypothetical protein
LVRFAVADCEKMRRMTSGASSAMLFLMTRKHALLILCARIGYNPP